MSHFTVLVIGYNAEKALAPYHEFECTGDDNEYIQDVDVTEEFFSDYGRNIKEYQGRLKGFAKDYYGIRVLSSEKHVDTNGKDKYGYAIGTDTKITKAIKRTNPNAKWDWWQVGGRWDGRLLLKNPIDKVTHVNSACKSEIDFEQMMKNGRDEYLNHFDEIVKFVKLNADGKVPQPELSWDEIWELDLSRDEKRAIYNAQPEVIAFKKIPNDVVSFMSSVSDYNYTREEYGELGAQNAVSFFAVVKDNEWYGKGTMGWWGMSSETDNEGKKWTHDFYKTFIEPLPDNALLTVVDCHI